MSVDLLAVKPPVTVRIGILRIRPKPVLVEIHESIVVRVLRGVGRVVRIEPFPTFPSVRHAVAVRVKIGRIGRRVRVELIVVRNAVVVRVGVTWIAAKPDLLAVRKPVAVRVGVAGIGPVTEEHSIRQLPLIPITS